MLPECGDPTCEFDILEKRPIPPTVLVGRASQNGMIEIIINTRTRWAVELIRTPRLIAS